MRVLNDINIITLHRLSMDNAYCNRAALCYTVYVCAQIGLSPIRNASAAVRYLTVDQ